MNEPLTAVSLFAGIGGFDLALERCGVKVTAAVEIDADCRSVLTRHFPKTTRFGDVTEVTGDQLFATGFVPGRGIITAGWPCQGNSVAGRRGGMADPRSGLWRHVVRLLAETRPRWFIGENVPGLLSIEDGRDFRTVIGDLDDLGYGVAWRVLDAQWFGVPQRRRRVFIAGCFGDPAGPVQVLLEPESGTGHPAPGRAARQDVAGTLGSRAGKSRTTDLDGHGAYVTATTLQGGGRRGHRVDAEGAAGGHLIAFDGAQITSAENRVNPQPGDPQPPLAAPWQPMVAGVFPVALRGREDGSQVEAGEPGDPAFTVRTPGGGSSYPMPAYALTSRNDRNDRNDRENTWIPFAGERMVAHALTSEGADASEDGTGRGTPLVSLAVAGDFSTSEDVAQTVRRAHGQPGCDAAGLAVRRLTPTECERLMGLPDDWTAGQSDSARYRQLGNSVAVPVVEWIGRRVVAVDAHKGAADAAA